MSGFRSPSAGALCLSITLCTRSAKTVTRRTRKALLPLSRLLATIAMLAAPLQNAADAAEDLLRTSPALARASIASGVSMAMAMGLVDPAAQTPPPLPPQLGKYRLPLLNAALSAGRVHTYTGQYHHVVADLATKGRGPSPTLLRAYVSDGAMNGPLGPGWTHSYLTRLIIPTGPSRDYTLVGPLGREDVYTRALDGSFPTLPLGVTTKLQQNPDGSYTAIHKDQSTWTFNATGKLATYSDRFGNTSSVYYDAQGRVGTVTDPAGRGSFSFFYDAQSRLQSVSDWSTPARTVQYGYDGQGRLTTVTDADGGITTYGYDGTSTRLSTVTDARGVLVLRNTYDAAGRVLEQFDAYGVSTGEHAIFSYTATSTNVSYPPTSWRSTFRPSVQDDYNGNGHITGRTSSAAPSETSVVQIGYGTTAFPSYVIDALGNRTDLCFDVDYNGATIAGSQGNLSRVIRPPATAGTPRPTLLLAHDWNNNVIETIPARGVGTTNSISCTSDLHNSLAVNFATSYAYDATARKLESVTRRWVEPGVGVQTAVTKLEWSDPANPGRITRAIPPKGNTGPTPDPAYAATFTWGASGNSAGLLTAIFGPDGATTTFSYDQVGELLSLVDPNGNYRGNSAADHIWSFAYNRRGQVTQRSAPPPVNGGAPLVTTYSRNAIGRVTAVTEPNGSMTRYSYDARGRLEEVQQSATQADPNNDPNKIRTRLTYGNAGELNRVTRAVGLPEERVADIGLDGRGKLREYKEYPNGPGGGGELTRSYGYDSKGRRVSATQPSGQTTQFTYDANNRLTNINYNDAQTPNVSFTHDMAGNRLTMTDGAGTTNYTYDERNRRIAASVPTKPGNPSVQYRYDLNGQRKQLIYPDGKTLAYNRDTAGRVTSTTDWANRVTSIDRGIDGRVNKITHVNGTTTSYSRDNAQRLTSVTNAQGTGQLIATHVYGMDASGNRITLDEQRPRIAPAPPPRPPVPPGVLPTARGGTAGTPPALLPTTRIGASPGPATPGPNVLPWRQDAPTASIHTDYAYDRLSRLVSVLVSGSSTTYAYNGAGNRTSVTRGSTTTPFSYDKADRPTSAGGTAYTWSQNGNLIARGLDLFVFDAANRLKNATVNGATSTYTYYGDGRRATTVSGGSTTTPVYDVNRRLATVIDDDQAKYVRPTGLSYATNPAGTDVSHVYHKDSHGDVRALTDASGSVQQTYQYDEYGAVIQSQGARSQPFGYTGQQQDATGLINLRARVYDPASGVFLQRDSYLGQLRSPLSLNRTTFALSNPIRMSDPSGHLSLDAVRDIDNFVSTHDPEQLAELAAYTAVVAAGVVVAGEAATIATTLAAAGVISESAVTAATWGLAAGGGVIAATGGAAVNDVISDLDTLGPTATEAPTSDPNAEPGPDQPGVASPSTSGGPSSPDDEGGERTTDDSGDGQTGGDHNEDSDSGDQSDGADE
ncbi:MAG: RHS repeat-associated core domain-containing protein [Chloroflexota bacterium]